MLISIFYHIIIFFLRRLFESIPTTCFTFCDFSIGPVFFAYTTIDLLSKQGRQNVPLGLNISWNIMIWGVVIGSFPWIQECVEMLSDGLETKYGMNSEL
jgi:hypothetical protein